MATHDIRTRREIVINVGKPGGRPDEVKKKKKGTIPPNKPKSGILTRRRRPGGITFYDFGDAISGADPYASYVSPLVGGAITGVSQEDGAPARASVQSQVLAIASPFSHFRPISKTGNIASGVRVVYTDDEDGEIDSTLDDLDDFAGTSLTLTDAEAATLVVYGRAGFWFLDEIYLNSATPGTLLKFTSAPSFAAADVAFTPSARMDIGLMPSLPAQTGQASFPSPDEPFISASDTYNGIIAPLPRSAAPAAAYFPLSYAAMYEIIRLMKASPDARGRRQTESAGPWFAINTSQWLPPEHFPPPPAEPNPSESSIVQATITVERFSLEAGTLLAIVRKSGSLFYIWHNP